MRLDVLSSKSRGKRLRQLVGLLGVSHLKSVKVLQEQRMVIFSEGEEKAIYIHVSKI